MALPVFPSLPGLAFPVDRETVWDTVPNDALSGKRTRYSNRSYPTYNFVLTFGDPEGFLRSSAAFLELQLLQGFINKLTGGVGIFLFDWPTDDMATSGALGTGDGVTTAFQMTRTFGGFTEPVFAPNVITDVRIAGAPTSAYTLGNYGKVIFNAPPAGGTALTWNGTFYWVCRMDDDVTKFSNIMLNLFQLKTLKFSTEKLP